MSTQSEQEFIDQFAGQENLETENQNTDEGQLDNLNDNTENNEAQHEFSASEQKAYDQGWRPQEEFEGDEDNWKTAKEYNRDGEWLAKLKDQNAKFDRQQQEFDRRLGESNKYHEARRKQELDNLKADQRSAVDLADTDAYDSATRKIDEFHEQSLPAEAPQQKQLDPQIQTWVDKNPWINDPNDDRAIMAAGALNQFQQTNPQGSIQEAIAFVEDRVNRISRPGNPRREQPNSTENNRKPAQRRGSRELTMNDLTAAEQSEWNSFGRTIYKNEKAFLKAVKDVRGK